MSDVGPLGLVVFKRFEGALYYLSGILRTEEDYGVKVEYSWTAKIGDAKVYDNVDEADNIAEEIGDDAEIKLLL